MSDWPPKPMAIERVHPHTRYKNILTIQDTNGQAWHYMQRDDGDLILGYPWIAFDKKGNHQVHFFQPLAPHAIAILLEVECTK